VNAFGHFGVCDPLATRFSGVRTADLKMSLLPKAMFRSLHQRLLCGLSRRSLRLAPRTELRTEPTFTAPFTNDCSADKTVIRF
jgi:hypothetical protein